MVRDYELMYIVRPDLDEEGLTAAMESVQTLVEGQGGEVVRTTPWGKRRLAYEIERMRDGHYVLLHIRLDGAKVRAVEQLLHIHDSVFRHLITVWVDTRGKGEEGELEPDATAERDVAAPNGDRPRAARVEEGEAVAVAAVGDGDADADEDVDDEDTYPSAEEDE